jgi:PBP1b-binding outer membrane lipoprotein LpoB
MRIKFAFSVIFIALLFIGCNKEEIVKTNVSPEQLPNKEGLI